MPYNVVKPPHFMSPENFANAEESVSSVANNQNERSKNINISIQILRIKYLILLSLLLISLVAEIFKKYSILALYFF